ncbi:hypothetical protein GXP67_01165 [Rhodocytophaga rosea]|uniref:Uncharacterized protein n=1 Tax=Rhodocytophaga rosea TaxID=2704465 RepID=A0A6C0GC35_9BACT|nr:hypothetical protein [Rhodocytophaga rosea]QHT65383.1 hypothetical protein GXP67_01165 [Rhodocytophaga rosea]
MKSKYIPEVYFKKEYNPLPLSEKCKPLKQVKTNIWVFEMIDLYQTLEYMQQPYLRWCFCKQEKEMLITCYDIHGKTIQSLMVDIGRHHASFSTVTLCVVEGICMLEEECEAAMKRNSA